MSLAGAEDAAFRYRPLLKLASGGMATVYLGALTGPSGFRQIVAIKRPHAHLLEDPAMREEALAEARIAARIRHANVVDVRDVEVSGETIQLVMDYIEGATLSTLLAAFARQKKRIPIAIAARIVLDACAGLAAVHEVRGDDGEPLHLVHRDISPQNILVGLDGVARVSDFGTVKEPASDRPLTTQGTLKGKPGYMAPEYVQRGALDARSDELSLAVVAWEAIVGKRLFRGATDFETFERVLREVPRAPSAEVPEIGTAFDEALGRALAKDPNERYATVRAFAEAFAKACPAIATAQAVGDLVNEVAGEDLRARRVELRAKLEALDAIADPSIVTARTPLLASAAPSIDATNQGDFARPMATVRDAPLAMGGHGASAPLHGPSIAEAPAVVATPPPAEVATPPRARGRWIAFGLALSVIAAIAALALTAWQRRSGDPPSGEIASQTPSNEASRDTTSVTTAASAQAATTRTESSTPAATGPLAPAAPEPSIAPSQTAPHTSSRAVAPATASASASSKRAPKAPPPNPY